MTGSPVVPFPARGLAWARRAIRQRDITRADLALALDILDRHGDGLDFDTARLLRTALDLPPTHSRPDLDRARQDDRARQHDRGRNRGLAWARRAISRRDTGSADLAEAFDILDRQGDGLDFETALLLRKAMDLPPLRSQHEIDRILRRDRFWRRMDRLLVGGFAVAIGLLIVLIGLRLPAAAAHAALMAGGLG